MKRSSSLSFPSSFSSKTVVSNKGFGSESGITCSRRSVLVSLGMFFLAPQNILAGVFQCGSDFRIAILAAVTGPFAPIQKNYFEGALEAIEKARARGCRVEAVLRDADQAPRSLMREAHIASLRDNASVIVAPFGPTGNLIAKKLNSVLIFDLLQKKPTESKPVNLVSLPYSIFFTANPEKRDESLRSVGRTATQIVLETIQSAHPGTITSPRELVAAMERRRFRSSKGILFLNRATGIFELLG